MCDRELKGLCRGICPNARALTQKHLQLRMRLDLAASSKPLKRQPRAWTLVQRRTVGRHKGELAFRLWALSAAAAPLRWPWPRQQQQELLSLQLAVHRTRMHSRGPGLRHVPVSRAYWAPQLGSLAPWAAHLQAIKCPSQRSRRCWRRST